MTVVLDPILVAANADDVTCRHGHVFSSTGTSLAVGYQSATVKKWGSALRFTGVNVPPGATIVSAHLKVYCTATAAGGGCKAKLYFEAADDPAAIADDTDLHARVPTSKVTWDNIPAWTLGTWYETPELVAPLQEVVDRPGWHSGHAVMAFFEDFEERSTTESAENYRKFAAYDYTTTDPTQAELHISYTLPATRVKTGVFARRTSTGDQAITGLGFTPKLLILFGTAQTVDGFAAHFDFSFGASDGTTDKSMGGWSKDALASADTDRYEADKVIGYWDNFGGSALINEADLKSFDADGFTLTWTDVDTATGWLVHYLAIGGDDVECQVADFDAQNDSTGEQTYTHVGFRPDLLLLFGSPLTDTFGHQTHSIGFADSAGNQFAMCGASQYPSVAVSDTVRYQRTDRCFAYFDSALGGDLTTIQSEAQFVAMTSTGFTLDWKIATDYGTGQVIKSIAIRGIQAKVGVLNAPGAGGDVGYTGAGFLPRGALFAGFNTAASTSIQDHNRFSLGVADNSRNVGAIFLGDTDAVDTSSSNMATRADLCHISADYDNPVMAYLYSIVKTWDADGFTLTWSGVPPYATDQVGYLLLGDKGAILGAASLSGSGTLAATALRVQQGVGAPSASGTVAVVGHRLVSAACVLTSSGTVVGIARPLRTGAAVVSASGTVAAVGRLIAKAKAVLSGAGTIVAVGRLAGAGKAVISGSGLVAATGLRIRRASAAISGNGGLVASSSRAQYGQAALAASGTLAAIPRALRTGKTTLTATAYLTATAGEVAIKEGSAALSGMGGVAAGAGRIRTVSVTSTATGTISCIDRVVRGAASAVAGDGEVGVYGPLWEGPAVPGVRVRLASAPLAGSGTVVVIGSVGGIVEAAAVLAGNGTLVVIGTVGGVVEASAVLSASGTVVVLSIRMGCGKAVLSGNGVLVAVAVVGRVVEGSALLIGEGNLLGVARVLRYATASFSGLGQQTASGSFAVGAARAVLSGTGYLTLRLRGAATVIEVPGSDEGIIQLRGSDEPVIEMEASYV